MTFDEFASDIMESCQGSESYVMFHSHTDDSILDSCTKYQEYIDLAVENNMKAIAFSEHGKPLNWTEKWGACKRAGIKFMHSVEIYLTESIYGDKVRDNYHTVLIAKNMDGVRELNNLIGLSSDSDHTYYTNRISFDEFLGISDNIIKTSACLASPLAKLPESHPRYIELVKAYDFLEIQPHNISDQVEYNQRLYRLSMEHGIPLIAGTDTHSSSKYKAECRDVLTKSKGKSYPDDGIDLSFKTFDELADLFERQGALPEEIYMEAIRNTNVLADMVEEIELDTSIKYPILYGSREADSKKLVELIYSKLEEKLASGVIPRSQEAAFRINIEEELRVFKKLNMEGFMLSMSELICWCKENGIAIGPGRGSVGGSRVAYVIDIIDVNPETWNTVFSRFCNEDREEIGDIDIDCISSDRPNIFNFIVSKFGLDKTARVVSFGTLKDRAAIDVIGKYLAKQWKDTHPNASDNENKWSIPIVAKIKNEYESDPNKARSKYSELFYYFDGIVDTKISISVHPAGMVISPITLPDNYGVFHKDGEICLLLDMENVHDFTGLAKYDFLILKTVQVIKDTCDYIGVPYPKAHEIDWNDEKVWGSMTTNSMGLFQFEGVYAFDCLKKFKPRNIFDMVIVTACIRPSGASYRDDLLARKPHSNPSEIIDELLKDNLGYLIYQEDTIKFLQQICGLSGSEADNIRRAIGRKQRERLDAAMPRILDGYCDKSPRPRDVAENEAKEFIQILEDSASYQFGYNHSVAYCLLGYLCAYYRYYHPIEFITSFLNNAANDDDIQNGTAYANRVGIKITMPKWGISRREYYFDRDRNIISKGLSSIKNMGEKSSDELYAVASEVKSNSFIDVLKVLDHTRINSGNIEDLIKIDFFSDFGNQRELLKIVELYTGIFKKGNAVQIARSRIAGTPIDEVVKKYSIGVTKSGQESKRYSIVDIESAMYEAEEVVLQSGIQDFDDIEKVKNFNDIMGYIGYNSGKEEDRRKLYILDIYPLVRKKDGKQFGFSFITKSIGSGIESRFTVVNSVYEKEPVNKGDIILCTGWERNGQYFRMNSYVRI